MTADWLLSGEEEEKTTPPALPEPSGAFHRWLKKHGWLLGVCLMCLGLLGICTGALARFSLRKIFREMPPEMMGQAPAAFMANLFLITGAVLLLGGLGLSLYLGHWGKKKK